MRSVPIALMTFTIGASIAAAPAALASAPSGAGRAAAYGMVFALTNDPAGNAVVGYTRGMNGALTIGKRYPTGGRGGSLQGAVVDRTASQNALHADRTNNLLYAVNPGTDTVTVFAVGPNGLSRKQIVPSGGRFPVSVTASPDGSQVFVLNARGGGSIQGYQLVDGKLVMKRMWHRDLRLDTMTGTADEFTHTPGQIGFSPDGRSLLVTTKASTHSVLVWRVTTDGRFPMKPVVNDNPGAVPFAFAFDMAGRLNVVNAGTGTVATHGIRSNGTLMTYGETSTTGAAVCWISIHDDLVVTSNTGSDTITSLRSRANAPLRLGVMPSGKAPVDSAFSTDGRTFYLQTGATNMIETYRVSATGVLSKMDSDALPGPAGSEGLVSW